MALLPPIARAAGPWNRALVPEPSAQPLPPMAEPTTAVTAPDARAMARTPLLPESATYSTPDVGCRSRPAGARKSAALPTPFTRPAAALLLPATRLTFAPWVRAMRRMTLAP